METTDDIQLLDRKAAAVSLGSEATAVPRTTLIEALEQIGPLFRTDELDANEASVAVTASTRDRKPFALAAT